MFVCVCVSMRALLLFVKYSHIIIFIYVSLIYVSLIYVYIITTSEIHS